MKLIRIFTIWSLVSFGCLFSPNSPAREWYFQPHASVQTIYETNYRLLPDADKARTNLDSFGFITYANGDFGVRSDNYNIGINATGVIKRYISDLNLNNDNVYVTANSSFNVTERSVLGLIGRYADETTLNNVIDTTADAQQNTKRTTLFINPQWTYALSELTSVRLDYNHANVTYGNTTSRVGGRRYFNNTTDSSSIELLHEWNASLKSHALFNALIFDVPDLNQTTNNYSFNTGIDYNFSETWTTSLEGGFYVANTSTSAAGLTKNNDASGPLFSFKTKKYFFETSNVDMGYFRRIYPRGRGGLALADVSYITYTKQLSDRFQIALRGSYNDVRGLNPVVSNGRAGNNYTFYGASVSASWQISPQMDLTGGYQYRFKEFATRSADSNAFFLTLNYKWDPFSTTEF